MEELSLFPEETLTGTRALIVHFDAESQEYGLLSLKKLRDSGVPAEIYPDLASPKSSWVC